MLSNSKVLGSASQALLRAMDKSAHAQEEALGRTLLQPLLQWLDSGVVQTADRKEARILSGLRQSIVSLCTENHERLLSPQLYNLALTYLHDASFGEFAERLLQVIAGSGLPHATRAQRQLNILDGGGSFFEQAQNTALRIHRSGQLPVTAAAMLGAGFVGRATSYLVSGGLRATSAGARMGFMGRNLASTTAAVLAEGSAFHPLTQSAQWAMGRDVQIFSGYAEHWGSGVSLMAALRLGGFVSSVSRHALHGTKLINGVQVVTRARSLANLSRVTAPVVGESGALIGLGFWREEGSTNQIVANALGLMVESRLAASLGHTLAPKAYALQNRLQFKTYQNLRQQVQLRLNSLASRAPQLNIQPGRLATTPAGAALDSHVAMSVKASDTPSRITAVDTGLPPTGPSSHTPQRLAPEHDAPVPRYHEPTAKTPASEADTIREAAPQDPTTAELQDLYAPPLAQHRFFDGNQISAVTGSGPSAGQPLDFIFRTATSPWGPSATLSHVGPVRGMRESANQDNFAQGVNQHGPWFVVCDGAGGPKHGEIASHTMVEQVKHWMASGYPLKDAIEAAKLRITDGYTTLSGYQLRPNGDGVSAMATLLNVGDSRVSVLRPSQINAPIIAQTHVHNVPAYIGAWIKMPLSQRELFGKHDPDAYEAVVKAIKALPHPQQLEAFAKRPDWPLWLQAHPQSRVMTRSLGPMSKVHLKTYDPYSLGSSASNTVSVRRVEILPGDILFAHSDGGESVTPREFMGLLTNMSVDQAIAKAYELARDRQIWAWQANRHEPHQHPDANVEFNGQTYRRHPDEPGYLWVHPNTKRVWPLFFAHDAQTNGPEFYASHPIPKDNVTLHGMQFGVGPSEAGQKMPIGLENFLKES